MVHRRTFGENLSIQSFLFLTKLRVLANVSDRARRLVMNVVVVSSRITDSEPLAPIAIVLGMLHLPSSRGRLIPLSSRRSRDYRVVSPGAVFGLAKS